MPFAEEPVLKPTSLATELSEVPNALGSDVCLVGEQMLAPVSGGQLDVLSPVLQQQDDSQVQDDRPPRGDPDGTVSLFAGMELVAPSSMTLANATEQECTFPGPQTVSWTGNTDEDCQERSAFPFLNV